jgi:hypothetical protein
MPVLIFLTGLLRSFGLDSIVALRSLGILVWMGLGLMGFFRLQSQRPSLAWLWILAFLTSPMLKWGSTLINTQILIVAIGFLLIRAIERRAWSMVSFLLALSVYVHYQAIVLVLPVGAALWLACGRDFYSTLKLGLRVSAQVLLLLLPWIFYVLMNWGDFLEQMSIQFQRLGHEAHPYLKSPWDIFGSVYSWIGVPIGFPKVFNPGKYLLWCLLGFSLIAVRRAFQLTRPELLASSLLPWSALCLWVDKPESWFLTLFHGFFFLFLLSYFRTSENLTKVETRCLRSLVGLLLVFQVLTCGVLLVQAAPYYRHDAYEKFSKCIANQVSNLGNRPRKIWNPTSMDVLVELSRAEDRRGVRHDYSSARIYSNRNPDWKNFETQVEVILHALWLTDAFAPPDARLHQDYEGLPRDWDVTLGTSHPWLQERDYTAWKLGENWSAHICQSGPFWVVISMRKDRS